MNHGQSPPRSRPCRPSTFTVASANRPSSAIIGRMPAEGLGGVGEMLQDVEHHEGVDRAGVGVERLDRTLPEVDAEALTTLLDRPCRGLDARYIPAPLLRDGEEQSHVGTDLEQPPPRHVVRVHLLGHPPEELAPLLLLGQVLLVHDLLVARRRSRRELSVGAEESSPQRGHSKMSSWIAERRGRAPELLHRHVAGRRRRVAQVHPLAAARNAARHADRTLALV